MEDIRGLPDEWRACGGERKLAGRRTVMVKPRRASGPGSRTRPPRSSPSCAGASPRSRAIPSSARTRPAAGRGLSPEWPGPSPARATSRPPRREGHSTARGPVPGDPARAQRVCEETAYFVEESSGDTIVRRHRGHRPPVTSRHSTPEHSDLGDALGQHPEAPSDPGDAMG